MGTYPQFPDVAIRPGDTHEVQEQKILKGIEKYPEATIQFLLHLSHVYGAMGKRDKRLKCLLRVVNESTDKEDLSEAYTCIAYHYEDKGDYEKALANFEKSFQHENHADTLFRIGRIYCDLQQYDKAEKTYKRLLTTKDYDDNICEEEYHEAMAGLYNEMGDFKKLIAYKEEVLKKSKTDLEKATIYKAIAELYKENDDEQQAQLYFKKAIESYETQLTKTGTGYEEVKHDEGYSTIVNHDTNRLHLLQCIAKTNQLAGWQAQADDCYLKAIEAIEAWIDTPGNNDGSRGYYESYLPELYRVIKKPEKTIALYEKLLKKESRYQSINYYYRGLARAYYDEGNYKKACEWWLKILEKDDASDEALRNLAFIYYEQNKKDIARPYLERYIELYPNKNARMYSSLAMCYDEFEEPETVLSYLRQAVQVNNDLDKEFAAAVYCTMGKIYWHRQENAESAVDCFRNMMKRNPSDKQVSDAGTTLLVMSFAAEGMQPAMEFWKEYPQNKTTSKGETLTPQQIKELPYYHLKYPEDSGEKLKFKKQVAKQFEEDLLNNPAYKEYFAKYTPESVKNFIHMYAQYKESLVSYGHAYMMTKEERQESYVLKAANNAFDLILQKKLFNMQILWRAHQLPIPEIELCYDFHKWTYSSYGAYTDCPFIEEVTKEEVEVMKQFLMDDNYSGNPRFFLHSWQDYEELTKKNAEGDMEFMPEWYEFYDGRLGTGALLTLPDERGQKENYYKKLYRDWKSKQPKETPPAPVVQPPFIRDLIPYKTQYNEFMNAFENNYLNLLHKRYEEEFEYPDKFYSREKLMDAMVELEQAKIPVYVEGGMLWYDAVIKAARQYKNNKTVEKLDEFYASYCMNRELLSGLSISTPAALSSNNPGHDTTRDMIVEQILKGRELNGEPRDFNF